MTARLGVTIENIIGKTKKSCAKCDRLKMYLNSIKRPIYVFHPYNSWVFFDLASRSPTWRFTKLISAFLLITCAVIICYFTKETYCELIPSNSGVTCVRCKRQVGGPLSQKLICTIGVGKGKEKNVKKDIESKISM